MNGEPAIPCTLESINAMTAEDAAAFLSRACGSSRWARLVADSRPLRSLDHALACAETAFDALADTDWLEAFSHHPRIGDTGPADPRLAPTRHLSAREQSGMAAADDDTRRAFVAGNAEYVRRFGHVFLICATGKSAGEMLAALRARLANDPPTERRNAAAEQRLITAIRLRKLLSP